MKKYLLFLDECGDPSLESINQIFPVFTLMGMLISEEEYRKMNLEIDKLKRKIFGTNRVILHSRDIRKCDGSFAVLFNPKVKKYFYRSLNEILIKYNYRLVASVIKKEDYLNSYGRKADDPYELGLTFLLERIMFDLDSRNGFAQVILESRGKKEDSILGEKYKQLIKFGSRQISAGRFSTRFDHEATFRTKSMNDNGLQIADLCAYPTAKLILTGTESSSYMVIKDKFRKSNRGKVEGYGIKIFP